MRLDPRRLWLCVPFYAFFLFDLCVTLAGQPPQYWAGNHSAVVEGFPAAAWALSKGPWVFALFCVGWLAAFTLFILALPRFLAETLSLALLIGHAWGAMTWLAFSARLDYSLCLLFLVAASALYVTARGLWQRADAAGRDGVAAGDARPAPR
ncbi:MAG: hypothetical protein AAB215_01260 [Planctomycetota bacterium]